MFEKNPDQRTRLLAALAPGHRRALLAGCLLGFGVLIGCDVGSSGSSGTTTSSSGGTTTSTSFVQVERLGRPAINEGLVYTNSFLNAFNSISPDLDESDATLAVRTQVVEVLDAVDLADATDNVSASVIANAFLPDVMRINTALNNAPGTGAYASALNALGAPVGGRKIEDDVVDITLTVLVGAAVTDNVSYSAVGVDNNAVGHNMLNEQVTVNGTATFPFLAPAN